MGLGIGLVSVALGGITLQSDIASGSIVGSGGTSPLSAESVSLQTVLQLVAASDKIRTVPTDLIPPVAQAVRSPSSNIGFPSVNTGCVPGFSQITVPACIFGDRTGAHTMVLYGDSHAGMWFRVLDGIATHAHWKLVVLMKAACPAAPVPSQAPRTSGDWVACDQWHKFAINRINRIDPNLLIISQAWYDPMPNGHFYSPSQLERGLEQLLKRTSSPKTTRLLIADVPTSLGPTCLTQHADDVQACSIPDTLESYNNAEKRAAAVQGARYVNVTPWFCAMTCSPIIGKYDVYYGFGHVSVGYSRFLAGVLATALDLPGSGQLKSRH